jgi:bacillithiol biosynthesis cysteine-adding enzyme BshC
MQKFTFDRRITGFFSEQQNKLAYNQEELLSFLNLSCSKNNFLKQIQLKENNYSTQQRKKLCEFLDLRYTNVSKSDKVNQNLEHLNLSNTFTITTGHQLNIFSGPIYVIYKILHVVKLCEQLRDEHADYNFVPVLWLASEDHDFEEISAVEIFNKFLQWDTDQSGAVGKFSTDGLEALRNEITDFYSKVGSNQIENVLAAYKGETLAEAHFNLMHELFNQFGLIIIDADDSKLKKQFVPYISKEISERFSFHAVKQTNESLLKEGFNIQVNPRELNLFYLSEGKRTRIVPTKDFYNIEGIGVFSELELINEMSDFPEKFSPNVILRPLYQEVLLPNLCYVGGVGELSYWIQLKRIFDQANIVYPLVQVRNSILWINKTISSKMHKSGLVLEDLFTDISQVKLQYLKLAAADELDFSEVDSIFANLIDVFKQKSDLQDANTKKNTDAELQKIANQFEVLKRKLVKSVKQKHDNALTNIESVFDKLFPNGGLQERIISIFSICQDGDVIERINQLYSFIEPFDPDFIIIRE